MRVETGEYEASHGKAPRGRGSWAFTFGVNGGVESDIWYAAIGAYSGALKIAKAEARRRGADVLWVQP